MLTGKPPLGHLEPAAAMFRIGTKPTEPSLPETTSQDAKEFIKAALTWLVLLLVGMTCRVFTLRNVCEIVCLKACD